MREPQPTSAIPTSSFKHLSQPKKKKPQDPELQTCRSTDPLTHDPYTGVEAQPTAQRERELELRAIQREREGDKMRKKRELRRAIQRERGRRNEEKERVEKTERREKE